MDDKGNDSDGDTEMSIVEHQTSSRWQSFVMKCSFILPTLDRLRGVGVAVGYWESCLVVLRCACRRIVRIGSYQTIGNVFNCKSNIRHFSVIRMWLNVGSSLMLMLLKQRHSIAVNWFHSILDKQQGKFLCLINGRGRRGIMRTNSNLTNNQHTSGSEITTTSIYIFKLFDC